MTVSGAVPPGSGGARGPLISVVVSVKNGAEHLEQLIQSVLGQDYPHIEFIVIDDGSDDDGATVDILRRFPQIRWWSRPNRGQYASLNEGFAAATGEFVTTIGHDDWYLDAGVVSAVVVEAARQPDADAYYGRTVHVRADGTPLPSQPYQRFPPWMLQYVTFLSHCSLFVRRQFLLDHQIRFNESMRFASDSDWLARLYLSGCRIKMIDRDIAAYRRHPTQLSSRADRGGADGAAKARELADLRERYGRNVLLRTVARWSVTFHRRRLVTLAAWRRGGVLGLWQAWADWRSSRRPIPDRARSTSTKAE